MRTKIPLIVTLITTIIFAIMGMCRASTKKGWRKLKCRITYYHPHQDKWGSQVAHPKVSRAKEGVTVAAHPDFEFDEKIFIPELSGKLGDGYFQVQDRGAAVTKKKASKGSAYVFDIFVSTISKYKTQLKNKEYMVVYVKE